MSSLKRRLEALEQRGPALHPEEVSEVVALNRLLPEGDKRLILDLFESRPHGYEDTATTLSYATSAQLAAYRRYDALRALPLEHLRLLETRVGEDPDYLTSYLRAVDEFWRAGEDHGRETREARQAMRNFQRERQALCRALEEAI